MTDDDATCHAPDALADDDLQGADLGLFWSDDLEDCETEGGLDDEPWLEGDGDAWSCGEPEPVAEHSCENAGDALDVLLRVVGPERDGPPALWFLVLDAADRMLPLVLPITGVPTVADRTVAANLVHVLASVLEHDAPGGSVVVGYVRRGGGDRGAFEGSWSSMLHADAEREGVRLRMEAAIGRDRARLLTSGW
jgi:hypothetical protein